MTLPFFNRFSCFLLNFAESRSSCFQSIFSVIDFCPQLLESFFTSIKNTFVLIREKFYPSRNSHCHGMITFDLNRYIFFASMKPGGRLMLLSIISSIPFYSLLCKRDFLILRPYQHPQIYLHELFL